MKALTGMLRKMNNQQLQKVMFVGRATAETTYGWDNWAMISITEPVIRDQEKSNEAKLLGDWQAVHRTAFFDIAVEQFPYPLMEMEDARKIVEFVHVNAKNVEGIMVHCKAGISRSAAVAKWIALSYDLPFNHDYQHYNFHVYQLLNNANTEYKHKTIGTEMSEINMKFNRSTYMKHMFHNAADLPIDYEVDLLAKTVWIKTSFIDTALLQSFIDRVLLQSINDYLETLGTKQKVLSITQFSLTLQIEDSTKFALFSIKLVKRDFQPEEPTIVLKLIKEE